MTNIQTTKRNYAIDLIKFIAVLFITNSHYIPLYQEINPAFATLGVVSIR